MDESKGLKPEAFEDFYDWVQFGVDKGWIASPKCYVHDGWDTTPEEDAEMDEGNDPCMLTIRVWV